MLYALNLLNVVDYDAYRKYLATVGPLVQEPGGDIVVMGKKAPGVPVHFPGATVCRAQRIRAVVRG